MGKRGKRIGRRRRPRDTARETRRPPKRARCREAAAEEAVEEVNSSSSSSIDIASDPGSRPTDFRPRRRATEEADFTEEDLRVERSPEEFLAIAAALGRYSWTTTPYLAKARPKARQSDRMTTTVAPGEATTIIIEALDVDHRAAEVDEALNREERASDRPWLHSSHTGEPVGPAPIRRDEVTGRLIVMWEEGQTIAYEGRAVLPQLGMKLFLGDLRSANDSHEICGHAPVTPPTARQQMITKARTQDEVTRFTERAFALSLGAGSSAPAGHKTPARTDPAERLEARPSSLLHFQARTNAKDHQQVDRLDILRASSAADDQRIPHFRADVQTLISQGPMPIEQLQTSVFELACKHFPKRPPQRVAKPWQDGTLTHYAETMWGHFRARSAIIRKSMGRPTLAESFRIWKHTMFFHRLHRAARARGKVLRKQKQTEMLETARHAAERHDFREHYRPIQTMAPRATYRKFQLRLHGKLLTPEAELREMRTHFETLYQADQAKPPAHIRLEDAVPVTPEEILDSIQNLQASKAGLPGSSPGAIWRICGDQIAADPHKKLSDEFTTAGVGCPVSPLLFAAFSTMVTRRLDAKLGTSWSATHLTLYADDWHVSCLFDSYPAFDKFCQCLGVVFATLEQHGMIVSADKASVILAMQGTLRKRAVTEFSRILKDQRHLMVRASGRDAFLPIVSQAEYLGAVISYRNFRSLTLEHRIGKCKATHQRLRKILQGRRGLTLGQKVLLWRSTVLPSALYGLGACGLTETQMQRLHQVLLRQLRPIAKAPAHLTHETDSCSNVMAPVLEPAPRNLQGADCVFSGAL
ncbi:Capn15 [Symbiodinium sp. KB8]|nr:Capn15 [Symbiodinium sp. KB8]